MHELPSLAPAPGRSYAGMYFLADLGAVSKEKVHSYWLALSLGVESALRALACSACVPRAVSGLPLHSSRAISAFGLEAISTCRIQCRLRRRLADSWTLCCGRNSRPDLGYNNLEDANQRYLHWILLEELQQQQLHQHYKHDED